MITELLVIIIGLVLFLVRKLQEKYTFWEKRNIKHLPPKLLFGNSYESIIGNKNSGEIIEQAYLKFPDEDVVGYYEFLKPQLIIRRPEIIENILIKEFSHFTDRTPDGGPSSVPLAINLFNMRGKQWRAFRHKLSPIFTSGKLKTMFGPMSDCGKNLTAILDENDKKEVDMKEVMSLFAIDVIGSCAFGMEANVMQNPTSQFRAKAKEIFDFGVLQFFRILTVLTLPQLANRLGIFFIKPKILKYFCDVISNNLEFRKKHKIERNDFVQQLIQLQSLGHIELQANEKVDESPEMNGTSEIYDIKITDDLLMGTAFGFISAGFHTTASTLTYALYEMSREPQVMERLRSEVRDQVIVHGGITYDALRCMTYLEKVIKETMRLHPATPAIFRVCTKEYTLPSGYTIERGETVLIPVLALHRDPFLHADPYTFRPDRFDSPPRVCTYLPFGEGPRMCIAARFAMLEIKFALATIILNYNLRLSQRTKVPVKMTPRGFLNTPMNEVYFDISKV